MNLGSSIDHSLKGSEARHNARNAEQNDNYDKYPEDHDPELAGQSLRYRLDGVLFLNDTASAVIILRIHICNQTSIVRSIIALWPSEYKLNMFYGNVKRLKPRIDAACG